eukprot:scaffold1831_cov198-Alexandrium_tamarense.AAC.7
MVQSQLHQRDATKHQGITHAEESTKFRRQHEATSDTNVNCPRWCGGCNGDTSTMSHQVMHIHNPMVDDERETVACCAVVGPDT